MVQILYDSQLSLGIKPKSSKNINLNPSISVIIKIIIFNIIKNLTASGKDVLKQYLIY